MDITLNLSNEEQAALNDFMFRVGCPDFEHLVLDCLKRYRHWQAFDDWAKDIVEGITKEEFDPIKYQEIRKVERKKRQNHE